MIIFNKPESIRKSDFYPFGLFYCICKINMIYFTSELQLTILKENENGYSI